MATTIGQLVPEVVVRVENDASSSTRAGIWLRDALLEITADPDFRSEFDELEEYGPEFNLTGGQIGVTVQEYPFLNLVPTGDYNIATLDMLLWTDPPTNQARIRLENTSYQEADLITPFPGQPVKWYRFSDTAGFVPTPDKNYMVQARIYKMHPISNDIVSTVILINTDWNEVLIWAAVKRGFMEKMQFEKAAAVHKLLFGDPKYPDRPGILNGRKKRREKEQWRQQASLRPIVRSYGRGSGYSR